MNYKIIIPKSYSNSIHEILYMNHINNIECKQNGFLCYKPTINELEFRIKTGSYNRIAISTNHQIVGVLTAFSSYEMEKYFKKGFLEYEMDILEKLKSEKFIWLDQLSVHNKLFRNEIGTMLLKKLIKDGVDDGFYNFYGTVSLYPYLNISSINFLHFVFGIDILSIIKTRNNHWALIKLLNIKQL